MTALPNFMEWQLIAELSLETMGIRRAYSADVLMVRVHLNYDQKQPAKFCSKSGCKKPRKRLGFLGATQSHHRREGVSTADSPKRYPGNREVAPGKGGEIRSRE